jgi:hypothetical protein
VKLAACQAGHPQRWPLSVNAEGEVSLLVNDPVKPTVTVLPGAMVAL